MPMDRAALRMTDDELADFLATERTARVGTVSPDGMPHVAPLWFVWHEGAIYMTSLKRSRRDRDVEAGSPVAVCIDAGAEYGELRGAVLYGSFEPVDASSDVRQAFGAKYWHGIEVPDRRSHRWLRLEPTKIVSWDFAKIPQGRDARLEKLKDEGKA